MIKIFFIIILSSLIIYSQEGLVKTYFPDNTVESEIFFSDNIREGVAKFYYENGNLKEERPYLNGRVHGVVKFYHENGQLKELFTIYNGKRDGPALYYDENGYFVSEIMFEEGRRIIPVEVTEELFADNRKDEPVTQPRLTNRDYNNPFPPDFHREENYSDDPVYYQTAEIMPEPIGGFEEIQKKVYYPELAKFKKIEGIVKILAYIDHNGEVTKTEIVEGIGYGCDDSAEIAVFYTKFKPGLQRGKPIKVQMIIPVEFKLNNK